MAGGQVVALPTVAVGRLERSGRKRLRRYFHRNPSLILGLVIVSTISLVAITGPALAPRDPLAQDLAGRLVPPAWESRGTMSHILGTDDFGRDMLSRLIYGARISLVVGLSAVVIAGTLGVAAGLVAGYFGGWAEILPMRLADAQQALPAVLLAIMVVAVLGANTANLVLVLALTSWVVYARIVYGTVRSLKERDFVMAATTIGAGSPRILLQHILPNTLSPIIVVSALQVGRMVLMEAALSFLGLGVPIPEPSWGAMLADGRSRLWVAPWMSTFPGVAIALTVWGINLLGDGLRQALDPRLRTD